ncbi:MAG: serine/threonine protein kinase [Deltaproteobacteria bacterium]|nr:serine/threonine protein kinase [Deltaproteobacteria bacterium]
MASGDLIGGRYRVGRLLGRGGMGAVYAAENTKTGRSVALKVITAVHDPTSDATRRFLREAKAATAIQHPNVIEILDVFETDDGSPIMVMELLEGEALADFRKRRGAIQLHEAATLFLPVLEALHAAHALSIVHRDLKPENIFLARSSTQVVVPKVLDFGIAKVLDPTTLNSETQGNETKTGALLGTPHYMSMEQAMSEKDIDQRTDVWAVGVMLFELLCGRRPIEFESLGAMYTTFLQGTVPSVRQFAPDLPDDVVEALDGCLQMKREQRVATLEPLIAVLARYTDADVPGAQAAGRVVSEVPAAELSTFGASNVERAPEPEVERSGWSRWSAAIAVLVLAFGVGAYVAMSQSGDEESTVAPAAGPEPTAEAPSEASAPAADPAEPSLPPSATASATASASAVPVARPLPRPAVGTTTTAAPATASAPPEPVPADSARRPAVVEQLPY